MMSLRYLFGPISAAFAADHLHEARQIGECRAFNAAGDLDLAIGAVDSWKQIVDRLPADWRPDFVVLFLPYASIPQGLWDAPVPLIGLAQDWNLLWHHYRRQLGSCDLVLTDAPGVQRLQQTGIQQVAAANLYGCGRSYLEGVATDGPRDIDLLFVGNHNAAIHRERQAWLGRVGQLAARWHVVIRTGVFGAEYRQLLRRARIVFNRSIRGEANQRTFEAIASGSLLFQEADNEEVPGLLAAGAEYVAYTHDDLEQRLTYYLEHEEERRLLAEAGQRRAAEFTYAAVWRRIVEQTIAPQLDKLRERARQRPARTGEAALLTRVGQQTASTDGADQTLARVLAQAATDTASAALLNAQGLLLGRDPSPAAAGQAVACFQQALARQPNHVLAHLNLVEALVGAERTADAIAAAQQALVLLDGGPLPEAATLHSLPYPIRFDSLRVEWERAAWLHAGDATAEVTTKLQLARWRLHVLLAELTGALPHYEQAVAAQPDLPVSRAMLGCALGRAGQPAAAVADLRGAVAGNPFDNAAARALAQALRDSGDAAGCAALVAQRRALALAAPQLVPPEPWFMLRASTVAVAWEGAFTELQSLALVNREIVARLLACGVDLTLLPTRPPAPAPAPTVPLPPDLVQCVRRPTKEPVAVHVSHQWPPDFTPPAQGRWVLMQPWEFGSLPRAWLGPMTTHIDEVWVYTSWLRACYIQSGVPAARVHVIPLGVDPQRFRPETPPLRLQTRKRFKFLFVGGTIYRKGFDLLLQAYAHTFTAADDVCLVVKDAGGDTFYTGQTAQAAITRLRAQPDAPELEYIDQPFSAAQLAALYTACDCLVHPYRGEGFGLPIAEAMASGLPVIVTGYGAALDYCNEDHAYLLPARIGRLPERRIGTLETVDFPWVAEPNAAALQQLMRHVITNPDEASAKGLRASAFIRSHFTWDHTAAAIQARLAALQRQPIRRQQPDTSDAALAPSFIVSATTSTGRATVALCMIVKNEEHNLPACLAGLKELFDEIVVIDTGSSDRTREVAQQYGAKVFEFPWVDSFAAARNESLRHAQSDWIFWLDADDRLDEANRVQLQAVFRQLPRGGMLGWSMKCACLPDPSSGTVTVVDHIRLFPNHPDVRWRYRVHEQILPAIRRLDGQVRFADVVIQHTGYQDPALRGRKLERDLRLLHLENAETPDDPFTLFNLGSVYQEQGKQAEALPLLRRSLERSQPTDSIVRKLYALIAQGHRQLGERDQALATCGDGRRLYPDDAELLFQEALLRRETRDLAGAEDCLLRLLNTREGAHFASVDAGLRGYKARYNLAVVYYEQGRHAEAADQWRQVLQDQPNFVPAWVGLGEVGLAQAQLDEAAHAYRQALQHQPQEAYLHARLGEVLLLRGELKEAQQCFRSAVQLQPTYASAHSALLSCLNYDPDQTGEQLLTEHRRWAEQHTRFEVLGPAADHDRSRERRLKIGYLSPDLCRHVVARFLEPILTHHDAAAVEVFCYADVTKPDELTERLRQRVPHWRSIVGQTDIQVAEQIRTDRIDILIDLAGHTGSRLGVFARQPAPVQVSYLGYPNTTGLRTIDYRLTDASAEPLDAPNHTTESPFRLSGGFCCYQPPTSVPEVNPLPAFLHGRITFGALHHLAKLNGRVLDSWADVLGAVPDSHLLLARHTLAGGAADRLRREFSRRGITADRLVLERAPTDGTHWELYQRIDIALDAFPWSGHTTACEALWMGVPVLTLAGDCFAGRMVASVLWRLELSELIARTPVEYVANAVRLAGDRERLAGLRAGLRERMRGSPLGDGAGFTRHLEAAYRTMWQQQMGGVS